MCCFSAACSASLAAISFIACAAICHKQWRSTRTRVLFPVNRFARLVAVPSLSCTVAALSASMESGAGVTRAMNSCVPSERDGVDGNDSCDVVWTAPMPAKSSRALCWHACGAETRHARLASCRSPSTSNWPYNAAPRSAPPIIPPPCPPWAKLSSNGTTVRWRTIK